MEPRILIGVACLQWEHKFAVSFLNFWTDLITCKHEGRKFQVGYHFAYRRPVQMAQEEIAQYAKDCGCTHVLYIDDDIYDLRADMLYKLLEADKDVIGGIMYTNGFPHAMCAFRRYDTDKKVADMPALHGPARLYEIPMDQRKGVVECDLIPFGFTLMKLSVFDKIPKPWFKCDTIAPTDSYFCDSIMEAGIKPYAHFDVWLNHRGITRENVHIHAQLGQLEAQKDIEDRAVMITPDEAKRLEIILGQKMMQAEEKIKARDAKNQKFFNKQEGEEIASLASKESSDASGNITGSSEPLHP